MPFMKNIGIISYKGIRNDPSVRQAFKRWKRKADKKGNPQDLLNSVGERFKRSAYIVFNNPVYFPQAPNNLTPIFETGDLRNHFTYKTSWDNRVRRT